MTTPQQPRWSVTSQIPTTQPDANNYFTQGVRVNFTTDFGMADSVFVPNARYNAESVKELIEQRYQEALRVHQLQG